MKNSVLLLYEILNHRLSFHPLNNYFVGMYMEKRTVYCREKKIDVVNIDICHRLLCISNIRFLLMAGD